MDQSGPFTVAKNPSLQRSRTISSIHHPEVKGRAPTNFFRVYIRFPGHGTRNAFTLLVNIWNSLQTLFHVCLDEGVDLDI